MCEFCSAEIPAVAPELRDTEMLAEVWAEGLNRRARHTILAGGEPFLYSDFGNLISMLAADKYKIEIYTNLRHPVDEFLKAARGRYFILTSLHPGTDRDKWLDNVDKLAAANHGVRVHIVRSPGYEDLVEFIKDTGIVDRFKTALQGDQRSGIKSMGKALNEQHPDVRCRHRIYLFGPDGHRYHCIHKMMAGDRAAQRGHIAGMDGADWTMLGDCKEFGFCAGCDNNIEGEVYDYGSKRR
jgi:MoaA/NifB/PqqE/SkfB family radical SAM enzyme